MRCTFHVEARAFSLTRTCLEASRAEFRASRFFVSKGFFSV